MPARARGAAVQRYAGVATAVFPNEPDGTVYNNAVLERDLAAAARADAIHALEAACAATGITRFAAWVHETDRAMRGDLERRGYTLETMRAISVIRPGHQRWSTWRVPNGMVHTSAS
jgi:hypothetical protein